MKLESLIALAKEQGASDLHLEPGLPLGLRVRGALRMSGEAIPGAATMSAARELLSDEGWSQFQEKWSADISRRLSGVRCRINVFRTGRGIALAIRLLSSTPPTLRTLNLHPDLARLVAPAHGLVLVSGPTGSGKSSTLAALIQEINLRELRHILTIESPIEYDISPRLSFVRQREVGRDTPSFDQALLDALREDPEVLMVGELREPQTMRLVLNAAETGHLVLSTLHSGTVSEALQRLAAAFPADAQSAVTAQLADCLVGVVCQRLRYRAELGIRVPECEILTATSGVRAMIRQGQFFKIASALESGGQEGSWSWARYREWLDRRGEWYQPTKESEATDSAPSTPEPVLPDLRPRSGPRPKRAPSQTPAPQEAAPDEEGVLVIPTAEEDLQGILSEMDRKGTRGD